MPGASLLTTEEVARRLGVKRETVYAYVSRGLLERHPASRYRHSLFERDEVERMAARARSANRSGALELVIETELTLLDPDGRLSYRGRDAIELARFRSFEQVAAILWDGDAGAPWELDERLATVFDALQAALPAEAAMTDRIALSIAGAGAADPTRGDRRPAAVRRTGGQIIAAALDGLPIGAAGADRSAASRLWAALDPAGRPPRPAQLAAVDAALVLLADHELAASTLAARVAASAWADPYRVVLAGLGPLGGALHGAAPRSVELMLASIEDPDDAFAALERQIAVSGAAAGFGHRVYRDRDPRADHLLGRVPACAVDEEAAERVAAVLRAAEALGLPAPNVDLALGGLAHAMGLRPFAAGTIFTIARLVGLIAHAIEEYPHHLRFRPRASYVGPQPRD